MIYSKEEIDTKVVLCAEVLLEGKIMLQPFDHHLDTLTLLKKQVAINCFLCAAFRGTKINYIALDQASYKELFYKTMFEITQEEMYKRWITESKGKDIRSLFRYPFLLFLFHWNN